MDKLNKSDLVNVLYMDGGLLKKDAEVAVDLIFSTIERSLIDGNEVNVCNFGTLSPITKKARIGTDPISHKQVTLQETKTVSFHPSRTFKEKLNS